ncbi:MAG TPA: putative quinol monooxygenase [Aggregatilineales bacterium]|nr:putative quinol monooxygenase [Aggregatilineales bacterium]
MYTVHVQIKVKPEFLEAFLQATYENARNSIQEAGITRFDVLQQEDEPTHIVLVETYGSPEDQAAHRETQHYTQWRDAVTVMMQEPRVGVKFKQLYPPGKG